VPPPESDNKITVNKGPVSQNTGFRTKNEYYYPVNEKLVQLFNILSDPTEQTDLSDKFPTIVKKLLNRLVVYNSKMIPPQLPNLDPNSDPKFHNGFWYPWLE
jgi:hypothetical protein